MKSSALTMRRLNSRWRILARRSSSTATGTSIIGERFASLAAPMQSSNEVADRTVAAIISRERIMRVRICAFSFSQRMQAMTRKATASRTISQGQTETRETVSDAISLARIRSSPRKLWVVFL